MAKNAIDELAVMVTANTAGLSAGLKQAERSLAEFRKDVEKAAGAAPPVPKMPGISKTHLNDLKTMRSHLAAVGAQARSSAADFTAFAGRAAIASGTFIAMQAGVSGVVGLFNELKDSINLAAELEQNQLAFEIMLRSAEDAKKMLSEIRTFAATTPFKNDELVVSAKKLIAYGIAADQVIPTMKALGDVSAATGKPIGELSFLYGTLSSQQRAYTKDIYQFTNAGIPMWEELSAVMGKTVPQVQELVEEGKVGFPQVVKAFRRMTEEGGRYYDMTRRQGQTTAGVLEQASDAWRLTKTHLGGILIEELGIKDAAKDFDKFMQRVRGGLDSIRPAVRFIGDGLKAGFQVGHEFGRMMLTLAQNGGGAFGVAFPGIAEAAKNVAQMVKDGQNFKLDEVQMLKSAKAVSDAFVESSAMVGAQGAKLTLAVLDMVEEIDKIGASLDRHMQNIREVVQFVERNNPFRDDPKNFKPDARVGQVIFPPIPDAEKPPTPAERPESIFDRAKALHLEERRLLEAFKADPSRKNRVSHAVAVDVENAFLDRFTMPGAQDAESNRGAARHKLVIERQLPPWNPNPDMRGQLERLIPRDLPWWERLTAPELPPAAKSDKSLLRAAAERAASYQYGDITGKGTDYSEGWKKTIADAEQWKADAATVFRQSVANEFALVPGLNTSFMELKRATDSAATSMNRLKTPDEAYSADVIERAKKVKGEFSDPLKELQKELNEIHAAAQVVPQFGALGMMLPPALIDQGEYKRARDAALGRAEEKLGINQHYQLPDAVLVGTQEDARLINQHRVGGFGPRGKTAEERLQDILIVLERIEKSNGGMERDQKNNRIPFRLFNIGP